MLLPDPASTLVLRSATTAAEDWVLLTLLPCADVWSRAPAGGRLTSLLGEADPGAANTWVPAAATPACRASGCAFTELLAALTGAAVSLGTLISRGCLLVVGARCGDDAAACACCAGCHPSNMRCWLHNNPPSAPGWFRQRGGRRMRRVHPRRARAAQVHAAQPGNARCRRHINGNSAPAFSALLTMPKLFLCPDACSTLWSALCALLRRVSSSTATAARTRSFRPNKEPGCTILYFGDSGCCRDPVPL